MRGNNLNLCEIDVSVPVVAYTDPDTGNPDVVPCGDSTDADAEAYQLEWCKGQNARAYDLEFRLDSVFPKCELFTLFCGESKECLGLFRTKQDADAANKQYHGANYRKYAVLRIDFYNN